MQTQATEHGFFEDDKDFDECSCEHAYYQHEDGRQCNALTMQGRARCSCPQFISIETHEVISSRA